MANNERLIVEERSRDIGNFMVGRLLPFRKKRQVGPFTFIDHMGPAELSAPDWMDVDQHPHIGLCTFTYLLEGQVEHRDSTGAVQVINPGDVGLMTAGHGVTHTERTPSEVRSEGGRSMLHGYQIWIALPVEKEEMNPRFDYLASEDVPEWMSDGMRFRLLAGKAYSQLSPLPVHSDLYVLDVEAKKGTHLSLADVLDGEIAILVNKGEIHENGQTVKTGELMISKTPETCCLDLAAGTRILIFGGPELQEPRFLFWNFVSSSKERLEQAKADWIAGRFPQVPGDSTYIPLPGID